MKTFFSIFIFITAIIACYCNINSDKNASAGIPVERYLYDSIFREVVFDIPRLKNIHVDGKAGDWKDKGLKASLLSNQYGQTISPEDLSTVLKLGWDSAGLYLLLKVNDNAFVEGKKDYAFWGYDCVDLFVNSDVGSKNIIQFSISPGITPKHPEIRISKFDHRNKRALRKNKLIIKAGTSHTDSLYYLEAFIPFINLGVKPEPGKEIGLQVYINDSDKENDDEHFRLEWYYLARSYINPWAFQTLRLANTSTDSSVYAVKAVTRDKDTTIIKIFGKFKANQHIEVRDTSTVFYSKIIQPGFSADSIVFSLPATPLNTTYLPYEVYIDDVYISLIDPGFIPWIMKDSGLFAYENDIRLFNTIDRRKTLKDSAILFIGSSTIRKWRTLEEDMSDINIINRGFGGSKVRHVLFFFDKVVVPYKPSVIVFYEGDNDMASRITPKVFSDSCKAFIEKTHSCLPGTFIYLVSIKPCFARMKYWTKMQQANKLLQKLAEKYPHVEYIDVAKAMYDKDGELMENIFASDGLHLNDKGYTIWTETIKKRLTN